MLRSEERVSWGKKKKKRSNFRGRWSTRDIKDRGTAPDSVTAALSVKFQGLGGSIVTRAIGIPFSCFPR